MRQKMDFSIAQVILGIRVFKIDLDSNANDKCIVHPEVSLHLVSPRKVREWSYLVNHSPNISFWSATLCSYNNPATALSSISHREHLKVRLDEEGKRIATANVVDLGAGWNWPSILRRWGISPTRLCQSKSITNIHSFVTFWLSPFRLNNTGRKYSKECQLRHNGDNVLQRSDTTLKQRTRVITARGMGPKSMICHIVTSCWLNSNTPAQSTWWAEK